jgi:sulfite reductase (NADPH) hemoprotein beta-component
MDRISDEHGNGTFKLTTRQTFQFHGIIKSHLKPAMQSINKSMMDTIAACGDVSECFIVRGPLIDTDSMIDRNVQCTVNPALSHTHAAVYEFSKNLSEHLLPRTSAYHEIWLDKKQVAGGEIADLEPMYGPTVSTHHPVCWRYADSGIVST